MRTLIINGTVVNADEVNVRSGAGVANAKVTSLKRGTPVTVYEQKTVDNALQRVKRKLEKHIHEEE